MGRVSSSQTDVSYISQIAESFILAEYCKASAHCGLGNDHRVTRYDAQEPHLRLAAFVLGLIRSCFPVTLVVLVLTVSLYFPLTPFLLELA
jgi:hypothetical protein